MNRFFNNLAEGLASTWKLLSDTGNFLSRANLLERYGQELTDLRTRLYRYGKDAETVRSVREQVVALRRELRTRGHDLRLGSRDIALEGFRHDDAMAEGFRRLVLGIAEADIVALAGDLNHIELAGALESRLQSRRPRLAYRMHYLWSAGATGCWCCPAPPRTAQSFEELKSYFAANREFLLRKLAHL
jgi:hypothetical protein